MKLYFLVIMILLMVCSEKEAVTESDLSQDSILKTAESYFGKSPYLKGDESLILVERFKKYESYIGKPIEDIYQYFGSALDTVLEEGAIDERDALIYYYEYPVSEFTKIYLKAAVQYGKVVGLQLSSEPNAELVYSSARFQIASRGVDWTPLASSNGSQYAARSGDLTWQIRFQQGYNGRTAIVNVGTIKYSWCSLAWDSEDLWGKDGLGNKVDSTEWLSPTQKVDK